MDRLRLIPLTMLATGLVAALAACGSSGSGAQPAPTGTAGTSAAVPSSTGAPASATPGSTGAASSGGTSKGSGAKGSKPSKASGLSGFAPGVGSGPASSKCALSAAQVGAVVGEAVQASSLDSGGGGLACYYRATSSKSSRDLTVTVQKVPVPGLYAQSRKVSTGGTSKQGADAGAGTQDCTVKDLTFDDRPAFTTRCSTTPDRQRLGSIQWDYSGGRFCFVGLQTVGRTDRTPAELLTLAQAVAGKLVA